MSCCPPQVGDTPDPSLLLETVDGSLLPCYGKKTFTFKLGRKEYHQDVFITNTTEIILGMDFLKRYRMEFWWSEFGDYYMRDKKAQIDTLLEFIKVKRGLPSVAKVNKVSLFPTPPSSQ